MAQRGLRPRQISIDGLSSAHDGKALTYNHGSKTFSLSDLDSFETGMILFWPVTETTPSGWLPCDGGEVSRSAYSDLFSVIGTRFGRGDESTTFNLPTSLVLPLNFLPLGMTPAVYGRPWITDEGDVYITHSWNLYKQTGGTGPFVQVPGTPDKVYTVAIGPTGDVYVLHMTQSLPGDPNQMQRAQLYKQTGGSGSFVSMGVTERKYASVFVSRRNDVYLGADYFDGGIESDVYQQTGATGSFVGLGAGSGRWNDFAESPNGDVYVIDGYMYPQYLADIRRQIGGSGSFTPLGLTQRYYIGITFTANGNMYASCPTDQTGVYVRTGNTGDLVQMTTDPFNYVTSHPNGSMYGARWHGLGAQDLYKTETDHKRIIKY